MESSRIFVRGLPPSLAEDDFRRHFSQRQGITDAKLFAQRRIGYVGYRNPEEAAKAVKYFNKTFINMSRIAVELARPAADTSNPPRKAREGQAKPANTSLQVQQPKAEQVGQGENPLKRKRNQPAAASSDPKLAEYLDLMGKKRSTSLHPINDGVLGLARAESAEDDAAEPVQPPADASDDEYQVLEKPKKRKAPPEQGSKAAARPSDLRTEALVEQSRLHIDSSAGGVDEASEDNTARQSTPPPATDADWLRSRTSRLLGLLDEEEEKELRVQQSEALPSTPNEGVRGDSEDPMAEDEHSVYEDAVPPQDTQQQPRGSSAEGSTHNADETAIRASRRLFLRNLAYDISEDDLRAQFATYGAVEEVHVTIDKRTGKSKGMAYVLYEDAEAAVSAFQELDGKTFQGRLLHVLPANAKRETKLDEYALSKLPLKKQKQIRKKAEASASIFSWNSLYMNPDAILSSVADRLGVDKSAVLDPTSSDAAVKQAVAETHVIQETKAYFLENGVDLEAFKRSKKGDTAILIKNFSYGTKADELRKLFEEHGHITRFLMPPSGTIAIVEFAQPPEARSAFASLAYRKLKDSVLFLEKAPQDMFNRPATKEPTARVAAAPVSTTDLLETDDATDAVGASTLFVKNLNFTTSSSRLADAFKPLDGFMSALVKTKTNPKQPGESLSMGFGFVEFRTKAQGQAALAAMDGHTLDGHQLVIRASQKGMDAAEERRREDRAKKLAAQKSKVIVKNLPFETSKKDVRALLRQYGQLRTVRVPKKFDSTARGFAFAEFTTAKEAANAIEALRNTHLLGRKLVLEYAAEDPADAEEELERMQRKVGAQTNKVVLQNLLGTGRQKFRAAQDGDEQLEDE